jgi:hypothetical protein
MTFGVLLVAGITSFSFRADWSSQSWLDMMAYIVCVISVLGVLLYASQREPTRAAFWRAFRWLFLVVVTSHALVHALEVAKRRGFTGLGTIAFIVFAAVATGWIYVAQWIALTRLGRAT